MVRAHLTCQHEASGPLNRLRCMHIWLDGEHTSSIEARKAISQPAAETAFTVLVLGLSVRDKA